MPSSSGRMTTASELAVTALRDPGGLDGRTLRVLTVAAASYLGRLGSALAVLVTIPFARASLAPDLFGVWMMLSGLLAFLAFADLGVGNGVLNRMTAAHAAGDVAAQRRVMRAGYACTGAVGALVFAGWLCWVALAPEPTALAGAVSAQHRGEVLSALNIFFLLLAINIPVSLVQKMQFGLQCGHWVGNAQFLCAIGTVIAVPAVLALGGGLPALVIASLGMQVAVNLVSAWLWRRRNRTARQGDTPVRTLFVPSWPEWPVVASLLRTGSLFLMLQLAAAFAFQSDAIVIVHRLGQAEYGDFAVVQRVFLAVSSILLAGLTGLWPAIGAALASGDKAWIRRTLLRSYVFVLLAMGAACLALALTMPQIVALWVGMTTPPPAALLAVLAVWTLMEALGNVSGAFLNAAGVLRAQVILAVVMATAAFIGKWYLVGRLGAWGATLATVIAYAAISVPLQLHLLRRHLRADATGHVQP